MFWIIWFGVSVIMFLTLAWMPYWRAGLIKWLTFQDNIDKADLLAFSLGWGIIIPLCILFRILIPIYRSKAFKTLAKVWRMPEDVKEPQIEPRPEAQIGPYRDNSR